MAVRTSIERATRSPKEYDMLIDEIIRALRDPEYRAQLTAEARGAMPDLPHPVNDHADSDQESTGES